MSFPNQSFVRAAFFAAEKHRDQRRKNDQSPYINHPLGVADILVQCDVNDPVVLNASVLHDTLEDTLCTKNELVFHFGSKVANVVQEVTDDKSLPKLTRKLNQIEHSPHLSDSAKLVKLADKIYNLTDLKNSPPKGWSLHTVRGYFLWAHKVGQGLLNASNEKLVAKFLMIFEGTFEYGGKDYPVLPATQEEQDVLWKIYCQLMRESKD